MYGHDHAFQTVGDAVSVPREASGFPYRRKKSRGRFANDALHVVAHSAGTPASNRFPGENGERDPDKAKGDEMAARERFVIKKDAEKERAGRREVLQEPDRGESQITRRVTKPKERNGGDNTRGDEQDRQPPTAAIENQRALRL